MALWYVWVHVLHTGMHVCMSIYVFSNLSTEFISIYSNHTRSCNVLCIVTQTRFRKVVEEVSILPLNSSSSFSFFYYRWMILFYHLSSQHVLWRIRISSGQFCCTKILVALYHICCTWNVVQYNYDLWYLFFWGNQVLHWIDFIVWKNWESIWPCWFICM